MVDYAAYAREISRIREFARKRDIDDSELTRIFERSFGKIQRRRNFVRIVKSLLVVALCVLGLWYFDRRVFTVTILRNLQSSIYPGLNVLRKISVPVVQTFPGISEYYDEWCLVENPYFHADLVDCWPCTVLKSVPDLTNRTLGRDFNFGIPFTRSEKRGEIPVGRFYEVLERNMEVFLQDSKRIRSNNASFRTIKDVLDRRFDLRPSVELTNHVAWRVNRIDPARVLREIFPRPKDSPDWLEQSTERFVLVDEPKATRYSLPSPECSNVAISCFMGARLIEMVPSPECGPSCEISVVLLSDGNTLWYERWYWRPVSAPLSNSTLLSISYLISFC